MSRLLGSKLERKGGSRQPFARFYLYCEGKNTEPEYFRALNVEFKYFAIDIVIVAAAGVPETVAQKAAKMTKTLNGRGRSAGSKSSFEHNDQVWAIFDRDAHPNMARALEICRVHGVGMAYSNPCFEIWLLLHVRDHHGPDDRHQLQRICESELVGYDKDKRKLPDLKLIVPHVKEAEDRARRQVEARHSEGDAMGCPSTTVYLLTEAMRTAAEKSSPA
jgi:hypothetical protein